MWTDAVRAVRTCEEPRFNCQTDDARDDEVLFSGTRWAFVIARCTRSYASETNDTVKNECASHSKTCTLLSQCRIQLRIRSIAANGESKPIERKASRRATYATSKVYRGMM